ncbi:MAG: nucleotide exchange factor GrpE [Bacilli bacterium]|nr:nucleotide exchange factor GrpE [Bacilli bacterium]
MQDSEVKEEKNVQQPKQEVKQEEKKPEEKKVEHKDHKPDDKKGFFKKKEDEEKKKLQAENAELKDKYLRTQAEMQNMRRRMEEEKASLLKYEGEDLIVKLLPTLDNFERAIKMDDTNLEDEVSKFLEGFKMIYGNLSSTLQGFEVLAMDILNKPFDPELMDAVLVEEVPGVEPNIVVDVLQKGYTYKGKVIRHAIVKVSK